MCLFLSAFLLSRDLCSLLFSPLLLPLPLPQPYSFFCHRYMNFLSVLCVHDGEGIRTNQEYMVKLLFEKYSTILLITKVHDSKKNYFNKIIIKKTFFCTKCKLVKVFTCEKQLIVIVWAQQSEKDNRPVISVDEGKTWQSLSTFCSDPRNRMLLEFHEASLHLMAQLCAVCC